MHPLREEFINTGVYLQRILEIEISLLQDFLFSCENEPSIYEMIKSIREERMLQEKILQILANRMYQISLKDDVLNAINLNEFPDFIDIFMLRDQFFTLIEKINSHGKEVPIPLMKKTEEKKKKNPLLTVDQNIDKKKSA